MREQTSRHILTTMKVDMPERYRKFKRTWGTYYVYDNLTGNSSSLKTRDKAEAIKKVNAMNEVERQPSISLGLARVYLNATDPKLATRTWQEVMEHIVDKKKDETRRCWSVSIKDKNLDRSGAKASDYPDFIFLTNCGSVGFSTPASALQSFYFAMRNQIKEPLTPTRMKQLWDVPDDFDEPGARYSIGIGEGMGGEDGYRVVSQERSGSNGVRMTLEFERPDGSAFRRNVTLIERNGLWRMKPAQVSRGNPSQ